MNANSDNTKKAGISNFVAQLALAKACGSEFELEVKLPIGNPPKHHSFDLASADRRFVGECKAFAWTVSGYVPSAKITTLREAANYLLQLPEDTIAFIVMDRDCHPTRRTPHFALLVISVRLQNSGSDCRATTNSKKPKTSSRRKIEREVRPRKRAA
jgi:hypothetical protein